MGFAGPFDEAGRTYVATMQGSSKVVTEQVALIKSGLTLSQAQDKFDRLQAQSIRANITDLDKFKNSIMAMGLGAEGGAKALMEVQELSTKFARGGNVTVDEIYGRLKKIRQQQEADANNKDVQNAVQADINAKKASADLQAALLPILTELNQIATGLVTEFRKLWKEHLPAIQQGVHDFKQFIHKVFNNPQEAWNQVKGYLEQLMAWFFDAIAQGPIGKYLFKDTADEMRRNSKIAAGASIVESRFTGLKEKEKTNSLTPQEKVELERARQAIMEARVAKADELRQEKFDEAKMQELARQRVVAKGLDPDDIKTKYQSYKEDGSKGKMVSAVALEFIELQKQWTKSLPQREATAKELYTGNKYSDEDLLKIFKNGFEGLNIPKKATGTLGTTGKLVQNFGTESLVKLHGNEAVLTEDQLANMAKGIQQSSSGSSPDNMKFIAEGLINLNKQTAVSNKLLGEVVEYNRRLLDKSTRNRLLA